MKRTEFIKHIEMNYCCNESAEELISELSKVMLTAISFLKTSLL